MEGIVGVGRERFDNEEVFDDAVKAVGDAGEKTGGRANEPAKGAGFVVAGVGGFFLGLGLILVLSLTLSLRLFASCGFALSGVWVSKNRGGKDVQREESAQKDGAQRE